MTGVKKSRGISPGGLFLLVFCIGLAIGTPTGNADHVPNGGVHDVEKRDQTTSPWIPPSPDPTIVWPSPTVTFLPPGNLTLDDEPSVQSDLSRQFISQSCDAHQRMMIKNAWDDAKLLTNSLKLYVPDKIYADTMRSWMGTDVASRGGWIWGKNFLQIIGGTFIRSANTPYG